MKFSLFISSGVYVDDEFDYGDCSVAVVGGGGGGQDVGSTSIFSPSTTGQANYPDATPIAPGANNSGSGGNMTHAQSINLGPQAGTATAQLQPSTANPNFDSGIASYVCEQSSAEPAPIPPQASIPDPPTFLSPAPLPSSLFVTSSDTADSTQIPGIESGLECGDLKTVGDECEGVDGVGPLDGVVVADGEIGEVITTAGVPMGNLPTRSALQAAGVPVPPSQASIGEVWNAPPCVATPVSAAEVCFLYICNPIMLKFDSKIIQTRLFRVLIR